MNGWQITLWLLGVLCASMGLAFGWGVLRRRFSPKSLVTVTGQRVRILAPNGVAFAYLVEQSEEGLRLSPPMGLDGNLQVDPSDSLFIQIASQGAMQSFRSNLVGRDKETGEIILANPQYIRRSNRRSEDRLTNVSGQSVSLNEIEGSFVDLSVGGAHVILHDEVPPGASVTLLWDNCETPVEAWVLECRPLVNQHARRYRVRVQFRDPWTPISIAE